MTTKLPPLRYACVGELATLLGVGKRCITRWVAAEKLSPGRKVGRKVMFDIRVVLDDFHKNGLDICPSVYDLVD